MLATAFLHDWLIPSALLSAIVETLCIAINPCGNPGSHPETCLEASLAVLAYMRGVLIICFGLYEGSSHYMCSSLGGKRRASLVWNEAFASGQPFAEKKVPIEVWSLGRFKFKGIAGTCKVSFHIT